MAGDWIKLRVDIHQDPSVIGVACDLGITENEAVGAIAKLWIWANLQTKDGDAPSVTNVWVDRHVGITGFASALSRHGWLETTERGIRIPKFDRHNGEPAKVRALNADRNRNYRCRVSKTANRDAHRDAPDITNASPEKRREEKSTKRNILTDVCPETPPASSGPPVLVFPCDGDVKLWHLTEALVAEMRDAYPSLDIVAECRKALAWVNASPDRRKTARGMRRFLVGWLSRTQDRGGARVQQTPPRPTLEDMADKLFGGQG